jgi:hypothetical protein
METLKPVKTFFKKPEHGTQPLTVADYRWIAAELGLKSWKSGAKFNAKLKGGSLVIKASGDLLVYTLRRNGEGVTQKTYKAGEWGWENE